MKYSLSIFILTALLSFRPVGDIYTIAIKNIDGNKMDLGSYKGKKMLFIVLPLSISDSSVRISDIIQLQTKYQSSLAVIGIPSEEAGYSSANKDKFRKLYKDAAANFIIAEGLRVKKGKDQSFLFQWLTSKELNHHYDQDVQGVGSKFFVDEAGELYAVMGPGLRLTNPLMERIIARSPGKKQ